MDNRALFGLNWNKVFHFFLNLSHFRPKWAIWERKGVQ